MIRIDLSNLDSCTSVSAAVVQASISGINNKKLRLSLDAYDSYEEFDDWVFESLPQKLGLSPRTIWMHPINMLRTTEGEFVRICVPYRQYPDKFYKYFRMSVVTFDYILNNIQVDITKHSFRPSIGPAERLAVTLRYLATGMSYEAIAESYIMDRCTVRRIVPEVCSAIYHRLRSKHLPIPSKKDLKRMADDYETLWQFPNCCSKGALDGKHVRIKCPTRSGSMYFNYKHFYSIVLQAVADALYRFTFTEVGAFGKQSDGGIFECSKLSEFVADLNNLPPPRSIPGIDTEMPYLFVCDDAYPLRPNMMKPYSGGQLTSEQEIFNGRLSRARRCVECAFGILVNKWRLFLKSIETSEKTDEIIVNGATVLHNIVIDQEGVDKVLLEAVCAKVDLRDSQMTSVQTGKRYNHKAHNALAIRDSWKTYFNSPVGAVPWQNRYRKH